MIIKNLNLDKASDDIELRLMQVFGEEQGALIRKLWLDGELDDRFGPSVAEVIRQIGTGEHPAIKEGYSLSSRIKSRFLSRTNFKTGLL